MLLRRLFRVPRLHHSRSNFVSCCQLHSTRLVLQENTAQQEWQDHEKTVEQFRNIDLVRTKNAVEEEVCLYNTLQNLGISTKARVHSFNFTSENVIKFIKMGMINKNLAAQYCHYISELARTATDSNDSSYYGKRSLDVLLYLLRNNKTLTIDSQIKLMADVSSTCRESCLLVCKHLLEQPDLMEKFTSRSYSKLLSSCYQYEEWEIANSILSKNSDTIQVVSVWQIDPMIRGFVSSAKRYQNLGLAKKEKDLLRSQAIEHVLKFLEESFKARIQFITKHKDEFIEALEKFDIKVHKSPNIKMTGRCTTCDSHLPLYDVSSINELNSKVKELLHTKVENKLFVNSRLQDLETFDRFLRKSYEKDNKHFDLVIDGLNVAFRNSVGTYYIKQAITDEVTRSIKRHNTKAQTQVIINCIIRGQMLEKFKKILVIGRQHMMNWPGLLDFFEQKRIFHYFPDNVSKDDLHQLYAATLSPRTLLVSCDLLRDHLALMEKNDRIMLERWIDTHQSWVYVKNLKTLYPTPYQKLGSVNRDKGYFHVPVVDYYKLDSMSDHEPPPHLNHKMLTWFCCKINTKLLSQDE